MTATRWTIPRETVEWVGPVAYEPADATLRLAFIHRDQGRPADDDWQTPTMLDDKPGVMVGPFTGSGEYRLWAEIADNPETVVVESFGIVTVT